MWCVKTRVLAGLAIAISLMPGLLLAPSARAQGTSDGEMIHEGGPPGGTGHGGMIHEGVSFGPMGQGGMIHEGTSFGMSGWGGMLGWGALPIGFGPFGMHGPIGHRDMASSAPRGCGRGQQSVAAAAIAELPRVTVRIYDGFFNPSMAAVRPGTLVVFRNLGSQPHTATAWDRFDSGILWPGESCAAWFVSPGSYEYLSIVAADGGQMVGTVSVGGDPSESGTGMIHEGPGARR
jgi:plastocyanin